MTLTSRRGRGENLLKWRKSETGNAGSSLQQLDCKEQERNGRSGGLGRWLSGGVRQEAFQDGRNVCAKGKDSVEEGEIVR